MSQGAARGTPPGPLETYRLEEQPDAEEHRWHTEVVKRSLAGDENAFALIVDRYGELMLRTASFLVKDRDTAQDIVQESLIQAWKHLDQLREPTFLRAWLVKITVNRATGFQRQWSRKLTLLTEHIKDQETTTSNLIASTQPGHIEEHIDLLHALERLPMNQRVVLVLFYYHAMTIPEISTLLGVSENTLQKRLQSGLNKIRRLFQWDDSAATTKGVAKNTRISARAKGQSNAAQ
ncbi:MAG TPA: RNA polymerase sigma factor [Ktedonobacteraceae bacterium]|nr:RNA polymerase sigma factor [Ktedonobacteraceae bacterium]